MSGTPAEPRPTHTRGEPPPIDLDGIEMRWAWQWNESDDGEVRAWRDDVAALIDEVRRLRRVSNAYFEEMVRRTPNSAQARTAIPEIDPALRAFVHHRLGLYMIAAERLGSTPEQAMAVIADRDPYLSAAIDAVRLAATAPQEPEQ